MRGVEAMGQTKSARKAGMSPERLERIGDFLESAYVAPGKIAGCQVRIARRGHLAYRRSLGSMGPRTRQGDGRRRGDAHLLDDQADRLGGADDAVGAWSVPARRPDRQGVPRVRRPEGVDGGRGRRDAHRARAEPGHLPPGAQPHRGLHLRRTVGAGRGARLRRSGGRGVQGAAHPSRSGGGPGGVHGQARPGAAEVPARREVDVLPSDRRGGRPGRAPLRPQARRVPAGGDLRPARHDRHRLLRARASAGALRRLLLARGGQGAEACRRCGEEPVPASARVPIRRRRTGLDPGGLRPASARCCGAAECSRASASSARAPWT